MVWIPFCTCKCNQEDSQILFSFAKYFFLYLATNSRNKYNLKSINIVFYVPAFAGGLKTLLTPSGIDFKILKVIAIKILFTIFPNQNQQNQYPNSITRIYFFNVKKKQKKQRKKNKKISGNTSSEFPETRVCNSSSFHPLFFIVFLFPPTE